MTVHHSFHIDQPSFCKVSFPVLPSVSGGFCISLGLDLLFKTHHIIALVCHRLLRRAHRRPPRLGGPLLHQLVCAVWTCVASSGSAYPSACQKERCPLPREVRGALTARLTCVPNSRRRGNSLCAHLPSVWPEVGFLIGLLGFPCLILGSAVRAPSTFEVTAFVARVL